MSAPKITAIIPVRDGERYLAEAIDSVLAQTHPVAELIIADDGSSDGSAAVAEAYGDPVRCLRLDARGTGAAVDSALAEANGNLIAMLDADDLWTPGKIEAQLAAIQSPGQPDLVWGHAEQFFSSDLDAGDRERLREPADGGPAKVRGTMLARRATLERAGRFESPGITVGDFIDWYLRAEEAGVTEAMVDQVVLRRRIHTSNLSRTTDDREGFARVIAAARKRRRS